jgi:glyoxylase-like metal-dependent hydrolase (beta-lactamase superfamily II)
MTGADGKVSIDAGITASRPRILEAANALSRDPIKHLINTHWHFDHADGNEWLNAEGAAISPMRTPTSICSSPSESRTGQGRSLDETIAAKPTAAFDAKWGQFVITPAFFTRLVYQGV